jgi:hypothetical protein
VGQSIAGDDLRRKYDALLLTGGAEWSRDLKVPGRELKGIHFAMEFLLQQNRRCEGDAANSPKRQRGDVPPFPIYQGRARNSPEPSDSTSGLPMRRRNPG